MKSRLLAGFTLIFCFACIPFLAQAGIPGVPPTAVPFDAGLSLLVAAGVGYASKKAYEKRKKDKIKTNTEK